MLQRIRDRISGWIAIVIIALVAGAFVLWGVQYYFEQGSGNRDEAAKVNGVLITNQDVNHTFAMMQNRLRTEMGSLYNDSMTQQLKMYALQSMITQTALHTTLEKDGFRVGLEQIKAVVMQTPAFLDQGQFSDQKFTQVLAQMNETPMAFFKRVQTTWIVDQVMQTIGASGFALPNETNRWYALQHQERSFGYFIVPMESFVSKVSIDDAAIKAYYEAHQSSYKTPEKVSVSYLLLSPAEIAKTVTVTEAQAKAYYQSHLSNFQLPQRWLVSQITIPVAATATQADIEKAKAQADAIAAKLKEHKNPGAGSATLTLSADNMSPALQTVLSTLKVGDVSAPLHTANGFTLLTLLKKESAETKSFAEVHEKVLELAKHDHINQILTKQGNQLSDLTYTNPDSLAPAAAALHLPIQVSPLMAKTGEKTGIFANPRVLASVFGDGVLESGNNSDVISLQDGSLIVLRIAKKQPSELMSLSSVRDQIKKILTDEQASAQAGVLAYQLQKQITDGASPETIAKKNNLQWHTVSLITAQEKTAVPPAIVAGAFSTPPMGVQTISVNNNDFAVIAVTQVKNADASSMSSSAKQAMNAQVSALWGQLLQHAFVSSVMKSSHINIPQTLTAKSNVKK